MSRLRKIAPFAGMALITGLMFGTAIATYRNDQEEMVQAYKSGRSIGYSMGWNQAVPKAYAAGVEFATCLINTKDRDRDACLTDPKDLQPTPPTDNPTPTPAEPAQGIVQTGPHSCASTGGAVVCSR